MAPATTMETKVVSIIRALINQMIRIKYLEIFCLSISLINKPKTRSAAMRLKMMKKKRVRIASNMIKRKRRCNRRNSTNSCLIGKNMIATTITGPKVTPAVMNTKVQLPKKIATKMTTDGRMSRGLKTPGRTTTMSRKFSEK